MAYTPGPPGELKWLEALIEPKTRDYLYASSAPDSLTAQEMRAMQEHMQRQAGLVEAPTRTYTVQELNRIVEGAVQEARRAGFSEGYGKGFSDAETREARRHADRICGLFGIVEKEKSAAQEKADAADCYDTDNVRFSWKFHALQLKKLLDKLTEQL